MTTRIQATFDRESFAQEEPIRVGAVDVTVARIAGLTHPLRPVLLTRIVKRRDPVALRAELEMRSLIGLLEHPLMIRAMRVVAGQAASLLRTEVQGGRVLEGERPLEFSVAVRADIRAVAR